MAKQSEIKTGKIYIKDVFDKWYRIPEYQRPYVWETEEVIDLLEDIEHAAENNADGEYFLGSIVYQHRPASKEENREFEENDLLDGQQRLTSLLLLIAVIRDLPTTSDQRKRTCQGYIFQEKNPDVKTPERLRILFDIRDDVKKFATDYINTSGATVKVDDLKSLANNAGDISIKNMANAIIQMRQFFTSAGAVSLDKFFPYLLNKVLLVSVSTEDLEDAFRLFTVLNARGVPLRNSDILKAWNLGEVELAEDKKKYAKLWEDMESEFEDDFDRFLSYIRTVLVKEKARLSLIKEFEDNIYHPKEKDQKTGKQKPVLLKKGKETFDLLDDYRKHYNYLFNEDHYKSFGDYHFDNLIYVMAQGFQSTDWIPPILSYYHKFKDSELLAFLTALDRKFSADLVCKESPTNRIDNVNNVIRCIEASANPKTVLTAKELSYNKALFLSSIAGDIYGRRYAKYLLLKMDYILMDHKQRATATKEISIEHVLPQNPKDDSQWMKDFDKAARDFWTNKIGNLVLLSGPKNSSQGRFDYDEKKNKYFDKRIDIFPSSLRVMQKNRKWSPEEVKMNQAFVIEQFEANY